MGCSMDRQMSVQMGDCIVRLGDIRVVAVCFDRL